jgi:hypothetical protein
MRNEGAFGHPCGSTCIAKRVNIVRFYYDIAVRYLRFAPLSQQVFIIDEFQTGILDLVDHISWQPIIAYYCFQSAFQVELDYSEGCFGRDEQGGDLCCFDTVLQVVFTESVVERYCSVTKQTAGPISDEPLKNIFRVNSHEFHLSFRFLEVELSGGQSFSQIISSVDNFFVGICL